MATRSRLREEIRTEPSEIPLEDVAHDILGNPVEAPPSENGAGKRRPGRPRTGRTPRNYKAERARRGAAVEVQPGPAPQQTADEIAAENLQAVQQLAPVVQMGGSELLDDAFPERPYSDQDAEQFTTALVPVMRKHAPFIDAWKEEIALIGVVLLQVASYRRVLRERAKLAAIAAPAADVT